MSRTCELCGGSIQPPSGQDGMCAACFHYCYYHHAKLTYLNQGNFILLGLIVATFLLTWLISLAEPVLHR